mmetsp:Transcript_13420/g.34620  ORF Transcript_13420/g.34620 Transcript_13420/m.34620 type:complete len:252 (-) Transcript_13420:46-801(-)
MLRSDSRCFALPQLLDNVNGVSRGDVLVVVVREALHALGVVRHADHGRVHTAAHALHLTQREHAIRSGLAIIAEAEVLAQGILQGSGASDHAGGGAAHHEVVLAHLRPVEHGVEGGDLVHTDRGCLQQLGHHVHGSESEKALVLRLCQRQQRNDGRALVVVRVPRHDLLGDFQVLWREAERCFVVVLCGVAVNVEVVVTVRRKGSAVPIRAAQSRAWHNLCTEAGLGRGEGRSGGRAAESPRRNGVRRPHK